MQPLADALDVLQQQANVCIGYLLPTLYRLKQRMGEILATRGAAGLKYLRPVAKCTQDNIETRYGYLTTILQTSVLIYNFVYLTNLAYLIIGLDPSFGIKNW